MWRPTAILENDRRKVDISDLKNKFRGQFNPESPHDAYRFLVHMMNGVTNETVHEKDIKKWVKGNKNVATNKFFGLGVTNKCFGLLSGFKVKCENNHVTRTLSSSVFLSLNGSKAKSLDEMIDNEFKKKSSKIFCKECDKKVTSTIRKKLVSLPKSLFVVVDIVCCCMVLFVSVCFCMFWYVFGMMFDAFFCF